ncbi:MAG TPA: flagellar biosynthesis protein FlhA, partial [Paracoccus sp.]|nr:flagellar biosynthesis protein FlhA [Paracoccus sp. (in: a-proteobacteria)]
ALGGAGWYARRRGRAVPDTPAPADTPEVKPMSLGDVLDLDEIHVKFAPDLVPMVLDPAVGLDARITNMRNHVMRNFGLILPEIRLTDETALDHGEYSILIQGVEQGRDRLFPDSRLALLSGGAADLPEGVDVREPVYAAPARWISPDDEERVVLAGLTVVSPTEVLATHLLEVLKTNFARLLSLRGLRRMLDELCNLSDSKRAEANRRLIDELIPDRVPVDLLLSVLRMLLEERVSVRNLPLILDSIAELRPQNAPPEMVCEHVRQRMGFQLVAPLRRPDGSIPLVQLAPEWETLFASYQIEGARGGTDIALPPAEFTRLSAALAEKFAQLADAGTQAALVCTARRRRFLRTLMAARDIPAPVLSFEEIGMEARAALVGQIPPPGAAAGDP